MNDLPQVAAIKKAEELAGMCKCHIVIEDISPAYVPNGFIEFGDMMGRSAVFRAFPKGSLIILKLLPF